MGGSSNPVEWGENVVRGAVATGAQVATGGIYDPNTGTIRTGSSQLANVGEAVTGGAYQEALTPDLPKPPKAVDPAAQAKRAEAEAAARVANEVGQRGRGLSSTILGGSTSTDTAVLKKRKLLGE